MYRRRSAASLSLLRVRLVPAPPRLIAEASTTIHAVKTEWLDLSLTRDSMRVSINGVGEQFRLRPEPEPTWGDVDAEVVSWLSTRVPATGQVIRNQSQHHGRV